MEFEEQQNCIPCPLPPHRQQYTRAPGRRTGSTPQTQCIIVFYTSANLSLATPTPAFALIEEDKGIENPKLTVFPIAACRHCSAKPILYTRE